VTSTDCRKIQITSKETTKKVIETQPRFRNDIQFEQRINNVVFEARQFEVETKHKW
jgi:hypothetical protein